jgi:hypothetical protein
MIVVLLLRGRTAGERKHIVVASAARFIIF